MPKSRQMPTRAVDITGFGQIIYRGYVMEILFPVLIGGTFGAIWAALEIWVFLWGQKRADKKAAEILAEGGDAAKTSAERHKGNYVMKYFFCKYGLDIAMLAIIFLAREMLPFRWEYILLAAGIVLAMATQLVFTKMKPAAKLGGK